MKLLFFVRALKFAPMLFLTGALLLFATHLKGEAMMYTSSDIVNLLQRQGPKLFQGNQEYYFGIEDEISTLPFQGISILTPKQMDLNTRHQFPVILVARNNGLRNWEVPTNLNLMFAIRDIDNGKLWMTRVLTSKKFEAQYGSSEPKRRPKPDKVNATSISFMVKNIDVLTKFADLPRFAGTLSVTAICYDWVSNTTQVELIGKPKQGVKPLSVSLHPAVSKGSGQALPSYIASDRNPKAHPDSLSFKIDETATDGAHIVVQGSFSKTLRRHEIQQHPETIRDHDTVQQVIGVVPITFAILRLNRRYPWQQTINVPVYQTNISGDRAQGYFHADIASPGLPPLDKGQYVVYAFIEEKVIGPQKFEIK